jgi:hypothetical protein
VTSPTVRGPESSRGTRGRGGGGEDHPNTSWAWTTTSPLTFASWVRTNGLGAGRLDPSSVADGVGT